MIRLSWLSWVVVWLAGSGLVLPSTAQDPDPTVRLRVAPAAAIRPALEIELLPNLLDRRPGNAAVFYGKVTAEQHHVFSSREVWQEWERLVEGPLEDLRDPSVQNRWQLPAIFDTIDNAARCDTCDWQLPIRDEGLYDLLLGEVQELRAFARLVDLRARFEIARGRLPEALESLQSGYAIGRHAAQGPTLINGLVGIAVAETMSHRIHEVIEQPDAPNLYWALTQLPTPLIDMRPGIEAEMHAMYLSIAELRHLDDDRRDAAFWRETLHDLWAKLVALGGDSSKLDPQLSLTGLVLKGYPQARRALIDAGLDEQAVDAMPVPRVIALYTLRTYTELRDDTFKWSFLPYWQGVAGAREAEQRLIAARDREVIPLASMLLPSIANVRAAAVRADRHIAVLRVVEALRMYAAEHDGRLPGRLDDITMVPIPADPVTGQPFQYQLVDGTAVIEGPPLPGNPLRFEIQIAR